MKLIYVILLLLIVSCSLPPKRGNTDEEIDFNLVKDLYSKNRYFLTIGKGNSFILDYPNSSNVREVDFLICKSIERSSNQPQNSYRCWNEYKKKYPKSEEVTVNERLDFLKDKKNPVRDIGFLEYSRNFSLTNSSEYKRINNSGPNDRGAFYYTKRSPDKKYDISSFIGFTYHAFDNLTFNNDCSLQRNILAYGVSLSINHKDNKFITNFQFAPTYVASLIENKNDSKDDGDSGLGFVSRISFDFLIYESDYSIFNPFYYLTIGVENHLLPSMESNGVKIGSGSITSWYIGFKI